MQLGAGINVNLKPGMGQRCSRHRRSGTGKTWVALQGCLALTILLVFFLLVRHQQMETGQSVGRALWGRSRRQWGIWCVEANIPTLSLSSRLQHNSPSPLPNATLALPPHQTPPHPPPTPVMKMSSLSIQHQQPVLSSQEVTNSGLQV